jgi:dipeptidyl aminopeptidase/acylaminoacyl peptidase
LVESIDYISKNYDFVDAERLGVTGCSAGGYLTNWVITHTNIFKAAIPVASICNWYSMHGSSDNGPCSIIAQDLAKGKAPWESPEAYLEHSPITYVDRVQTPTLVIHGENDLRCPIEQGEQLFSALKKLERDVSFIRFPNEPHVNIHTMRKPSHTKKALKYTLEWFDKYLKNYNE